MILKSWAILVVLAIVAASSACMHLEKSYEDAVVNYQEYQDIYNSVQQIDENICSKLNIPATDASFAQISKAQQVNALQSSLTRWVNEYNAKSKEINRSIWKSNSLPYQLSTHDYPCYSKSLIGGDTSNVQKNNSTNTTRSK